MQSANATSRALLAGVLAAFLLVSSLGLATSRASASVEPSYTTYRPMGVAFIGKSARLTPASVTKLDFYRQALAQRVTDWGGAQFQNEFVSVDGFFAIPKKRAHQPRDMQAVKRARQLARDRAAAVIAYLSDDTTSSTVLSSAPVYAYKAGPDEIKDGFRPNRAYLSMYLCTADCPQPSLY